MARGGFYSVDSLQGVHALVVAGDEEMRAVLAAILRYCGALVTPVAGPAEVLGVLRVVKADVLVAEVNSADDGAELIRRVRALKPEHGGVIPAVAIAAAGGGARLERLRSVGFDAHMVAPLDPWELCRLVSSLVNIR
jgi:CheY-like chemotaxis protein